MKFNINSWFHDLNFLIITTDFYLSLKFQVKFFFYSFSMDLLHGKFIVGPSKIFQINSTFWEFDFASFILTFDKIQWNYPSYQFKSVFCYILWYFWILQITFILLYLVWWIFIYSAYLIFAFVLRITEWHIPILISDSIINNTLTYASNLSKVYIFCKT